MLLRTAVVGCVIAGRMFGQLVGLFAEPEKVCDLLVEEGFRNAKWAPAAVGYGCSPTNLRLDYYVSGDDPLLVKRVKLVLDLTHESGTVEERTAEFVRVVKKLMEGLGLKATPELVAAINGTKPLRFVQKGARVTFDPGARPYKMQALTVRDAGVRVVTIPRVPKD
ncbi:MAG: hypothetical protein IT168_23250 [Bryobacterales bacterium]|nr:hypothetical protein [Bryobacterales bacterium]